MTQFDAGQVLRLLAARHAKDVFVPECKTGETWRRTMHRADAWAMNRSWVNLTFSGYEIKVSREDFVGDDKWPAYLPLCHQFWFATAPGVIHGKDEVPAAAGWLEMTGGGGRLLVRKKAPRRDIEPPADLLLSTCTTLSVVTVASAGFWDSMAGDTTTSMSRCHGSVMRSFSKRTPGFDCLPKM